MRSSAGPVETKLRPVSNNLLMSPLSALVGIAVIGVATAIAATYRYRDAFNPLTFFCITDIGLYTVFSGAVTYAFIDVAGITPAVLLKTIGLAGLYLLGVILPYLTPHDIARRPYATLMRLVGIASGARARSLTLSKIVPIGALAAVSFVGVAVVGGGGLTWLRDPRSAYQFSRGGAGSLYALTQWCLVLTQLYVLWALRPGVRRLLGTTAVFVIITYFLGSKNHLLVVVIISCLYANFFVHRIPGWIILVGAPLGLALHFGLQIAQGTAEDIIGTVSYFDYFTVTAQFIGRFHELGFHLGSAWLSSLWDFVPRALVPDKPHEYGVLLIQQLLFPGAAEAGHTPGILAWALAYLDFGALGVLGSGILTGLWQRASYEYFLRNRDSVVAFALMVHFSIWSIFSYAPPAVALLLCILFSAYLRVRVPVVRLRSPAAKLSSA